jgi:hypothetical protein
MAAFNISKVFAWKYSSQSHMIKPQISETESICQFPEAMEKAEGMYLNKKISHAPLF